MLRAPAAGSDGGARGGIVDVAGLFSAYLGYRLPVDVLNPSRCTTDVYGETLGLIEAGREGLASAVRGGVG